MSPSSYKSIILIFGLICTFVLPVQSYTPQCIYREYPDKVYNFTQLTYEPFTATIDEKNTTILFSICGEPVLSCNNGTEDTKTYQSCLKDPGNKQNTIIGTPSTISISPRGSQGIIIGYKSGISNTTSGVCEKSINLEMICANYTDFMLESATRSQDECEYTVKIRSRYACPKNASYIPSTNTPVVTPSPTSEQIPHYHDCVFYDIQNVKYNLSGLQLQGDNEYYNTTFEIREAGLYQRFSLLYSICPQPLKICDKMVDIYSPTGSQACHVFRKNAHPIGKPELHSFSVQEWIFILTYMSKTVDEDHTGCNYKLELRLRCDYGTNFHIMSSKVVSQCLYQIDANTRHACPVRY